MGVCDGSYTIGRFLNAFNAIFLVFIPKKEHRDDMKKWISLVGSL